MSSPSNVIDSDVVIIGMGPVGKMAALLLARAGHSVTILERKDATYPLPRAVAHDAEIARVLQHAGMPVDSMPDAVEPYDDMYVWVNADDDVLHQVDWTGIDPSGWNNTYFYNQPALERHLDEKLQNLPRVDIRRGVDARVTGQGSGGVEIDVQDVADQTVTRFRARYALGADGASSNTRTAVEVPWHDLGYFFDWLVVDVIPGPGLEVTHLAKQVCDPKRPTTVVPAGPGRRRWEFMRLNDESVESLVDPERIWQLLKPFGVTTANSAIERGVVYTFNSGWAENWRVNRVFLLGDAAHQMPPFAGQGLAAGFRDCVNLAWKLDLVLRGIAEDDLLDSYASERITHVSDFIDFSRSLGQIICITDPAAAAKRDRVMIAERESGRTPQPPPAPRLGAGVHSGDRGGYLSRQGVVLLEGSDSPQKFDDAFGSGALIVAEPVEDMPVSSRETLKALGIAVTSFGGPASVINQEWARFEDVNGTYAQWFREWGVTAVLVRPDFYVFGTASSGEELLTLASDYVRAVTGKSTGAGLPGDRAQSHALY